MSFYTSRNFDHTLINLRGELVKSIKLFAHEGDFLLDPKQQIVIHLSRRSLLLVPFLQEDNA